MCLLLTLAVFLFIYDVLDHDPAAAARRQQAEQEEQPPTQRPRQQLPIGTQKRLIFKKKKEGKKNKQKNRCKVLRFYWGYFCWCWLLIFYVAGSHEPTVNFKPPEIPVHSEEREGGKRMQQTTKCTRSRNSIKANCVLAVWVPLGTVIFPWHSHFAWRWCKT